MTDAIAETGAIAEAIEVLGRLVSFPTISARPNHDITGYIQDYLASHGVESTLSFEETGERANIFATIGPDVDGGVILNGHMDVVPVEGQTWRTDPFTLTQEGDRLYGRGSVDMKGFLACVLASAPAFKAANLTRPIHIAFSFDEEIGGYGMPVLLKWMAGNAPRAEAVIVGEPTAMKIITGHKGGYEMRAEVTGLAAHSSDPAQGVNAISYAMKLIAKIEEMGRDRAAAPIPGSPFRPPHSTFNVGTIEGGAARNMTAGWCNFNWEYRPLPGEDGAAVIAEIETFAATLSAEMRAIDPVASVRIITEVAVPALDDRNADKAVALISDITGLNSRDVVSFGTDAGYFSNAGLSTAVFGPGSIDRAHKPDEYITTGELAEGLEFLKRLAARL